MAQSDEPDRASSYVRKKVRRGALYWKIVSGALSLLAGSMGVVTLTGSGMAMAANSAFSLVPAGQFFPVTAVKVLDTRDGTGVVSVAPLAGNQTVTFPVINVGQVPDTVSDVYVVISAFSPSQPGALEDFNPDAGNPGIWTVPLTPGQSTTVSDLVQVSSSGAISPRNFSPGATDASVTVLGYVQSNLGQAAGDTYAPLPYGNLLDTRSGFGAPEAQIPAGGSITIQVGGRCGVQADADGAALYLGAANATQPGFITAFPAGATDPNLRVLSYSPGETVRNLWVGTTSSSGQLTLIDHGSAPVDLMAAAQGYLGSPFSTEVGDSWAGVYPVRIADTRDGTGGVPATPVPSGGSITFTATGVPASGVGAVAETVAAYNPTVSVLLSVYPAGGTDPGNVGVNFHAGDGQDNGLTAPVVSSVSPSGREAITNHSGGVATCRAVAPIGFDVIEGNRRC